MAKSIDKDFVRINCIEEVNYGLKFQQGWSTKEDRWTKLYNDFIYIYHQKEVTLMIDNQT